MNQDDRALNPDADEQVVDELTLLKERAKVMGIPFSNNISLETLRKRVADKMEGKDEAPEAPEVNALTGDPEIAQAMAAKPLDQKANAIALRKLMLAKQMRLVRVRITNMDPKKKDLPGEIWTVANEYLGTVRKFVPYGEQTDDGFHIPYCLYCLLDSKRFLHIRDVKDRTTGIVRQDKVWAKEFSLDVLPSLTQGELDRLAAAQAAAGL